MVKVRWYGKPVSDKVRAAGIRGLRLAAEHVLEEANRTVPLEEGTLMRSGTVSVDEQRGEAAISYDTPYAIRQHEDLTLRHDPGRRAKWLEATLRERQRAVRDYIAGEIKKAMKE